MDKVKTNYFVDALMLIFGLLCGLTGIMKLDILIPLELYKIIDYKLLSLVHDLSGVIIIILVIIHIILHMNWIICVTKSLFFNKEKKCK